MGKNRKDLLAAAYAAAVAISESRSGEELELLADFFNILSASLDLLADEKQQDDKPAGPEKNKK